MLVKCYATSVTCVSLHIELSVLNLLYFVLFSSPMDSRIDERLLNGEDNLKPCSVSM